MSSNSAKFQIIPMTIEHVPDVLKLWQVTEGLIITYSDNAKDLAQYFEHNPELSQVAVREGAIVGAVLCGCDGRRGYLHHLAVLSDCRTQGIGRALVQTCLNKLRVLGIRQCNLFVIEDNIAGMQFWENDGWMQWDNIRMMSKPIESES